MAGGRSRRAGHDLTARRPDHREVQAPKEDQLGVRGAKYFLVFRLVRNGRVGADYAVTLKMSARMQ